MQSHQIDEINIKVVILGNGGVGKTSIVNSLFEKEFPDRYIPTIGSNINSKEYKIKSRNVYLKVAIWDVGGQKSFNPLNPAFYNNVDAAFLVIDLANPEETLLEIKNTYLPNLFQYAQDCLSFIVANKLDLIDSNSELEGIISKHFKDDIPLVLTSAKNNQNIQEILELLIYTYLKEIEVKTKISNLENISSEFLKMIGKTEEDLDKVYVNRKNVESVSIARERKVTIKKKTISAYETDEAKLREYRALQLRMSKIDGLKQDLIQEFKKNLNVVKDLISALKKTPIESLNSSIDNTSKHLDQMRADFELNLDSLVKLDENGKLGKDLDLNEEKQEKHLEKNTKKEEIKVIDDDIKIIDD